MNSTRHSSPCLGSRRQPLAIQCSWPTTEASIFETAGCPPERLEEAAIDPAWTSRLDEKRLVATSLTNGRDQRIVDPMG